MIFIYPCLDFLLPVGGVWRNNNAALSSGAHGACDVGRVVRARGVWITRTTEFKIDFGLCFSGGVVHNALIASVAFLARLPQICDQLVGSVITPDRVVRLVRGESETRAVLLGLKRACGWRHHPPRGSE